MGDEQSIKQLREAISWIDRNKQAIGRAIVHRLAVLVSDFQREVGYCPEEVFGQTIPVSNALEAIRRDAAMTDDEFRALHRPLVNALYQCCHGGSVLTEDDVVLMLQHVISALRDAADGRERRANDLLRGYMWTGAAIVACDGAAAAAAVATGIPATAIPLSFGLAAAVFTAGRLRGDLS